MTRAGARSRRCVGLWLASHAALVAVVPLSGCGDRRDEPRDAPSPGAATAPTTPHEPARYVGAPACASCHAAEAGRWRGSHHDLAMQEATAETVLGDFDDTSLASRGVATSFRTERDGDGERFVVRAQGPDGALRDFEVAYTFGVFPLQQYLVPLPGGRLQALTVAWDARPREAGGQRWMDLVGDDARAVPGDPLHWTGAAFNWNSRCAECHSTGVESRYAPGDDLYDTTWQEIDVACEACHGPGSRHAADPEGSGPPVSFPDDGARWIFEGDAPIAHRQPALDSRAEVETCGACHARRSRIAPDAHAGGPLLDAYRLALLDEGLYFADGQIRDEVYVYGSFLQSRMYAAGVTCSDCHDPHDLSLRARGNALCGRCHRPAHYDTPEHHHHAADSAGARCVACHMPSRTYMRVDERADHGLRVPRPDLAAEIGVPNACAGCHAGRGADWAARAVASWRGGAPGGREPHFARAIDAGRGGRPGASRALRALAEDRAVAGIVRATALRLLGAQPELPATPAATLARALADADPLVRSAALESAEALPPRDRARLAAPLLRDPVRGVRIEAARVLAPVAAALEPGLRRAFERALDEYRAAQHLNADRPEAHVNLGSLDAQRGDLAAARRSYETARRLAPWFVPAAVNLADLARREGREADAEAVLRDVLDRVPDVPEVHYALGLSLVRQGRRDEGLAALARAVELAPDRSPEGARFAYVHAVALHDTGRPAAALRALEDALAHHPGHRPILEALVAYHREAGDAERAAAYARELAGAGRGLRPGGD